MINAKKNDFGENCALAWFQFKSTTRLSSKLHLGHLDEHTLKENLRYSSELLMRSKNEKKTSKRTSGGISYLMYTQIYPKVIHR